jgi:hypothetical protein
VSRAGGIWSGVCVGAWLTSCGVPEGSGNLAEEFFAARDRVLCEKSFECCTREDPWVGGIGDVQTCLDLSPNDSRATELRRALAAGTATLDEAGVQACLSALRRADCSTLAALADGTEFSVCRGLLVGQREEGEACVSAFECRTRNCRLVDPTGQSGHSRVCGAVTSQEGARCGAVADGTSCAPPLECDPAPGDGLACRRLLPGGAACERSPDCASQFCDEAGRCLNVCRVPLESEVATLR